MEEMFYKCHNLKKIIVSDFHINEHTAQFDLFEGCSNEFIDFMKNNNNNIINNNNLNFVEKIQIISLGLLLFIIIMYYFIYYFIR